MAEEPTIRGVFVKSHINALGKKRGEEGLKDLEKRYGASIDIGDTDNVPVREEVKILEYIVDILSPKPLAPVERAFEAGKLHFNNFTTTPLWTLVTSIFGKNIKLLLMQSANIAGRVFHGITFHSQDIGERSVRITMENNDYPLEHFQGFFDAWLTSSGVSGNVEAYARSENIYEYLISWNEPHIKVVSEK